MNLPIWQQFLQIVIVLRQTKHNIYTYCSTGAAGVGAVTSAAMSGATAVVGGAIALLFA